MTKQEVADFHNQILHKNTEALINDAEKKIDRQLSLGHSASDVYDAQTSVFLLQLINLSFENADNINRIEQKLDRLIAAQNI